MSDIYNRQYDEHFIDNHLTVPSSFALSEELRTKADSIADAGKSEAATYGPLQTLLTSLSKDLHDTLEPQLKDKLRRLHRVPDGVDGHLVFLDLHNSPPTHFPVEALRLKASPKAEPDLLGAYGIDMSNPPATLPYHRVEAIVEAKAAKKYAGLEQAASYAYLFQQARPDRPACYCLIVKPEWYQVIVSEPSGIVSSPKYHWGDLSLLIAYLYSHYVPPPNHALIDETIRWDDDSGLDRLALPTWSIRCGTRTFSKGTLLSIGSPWRRRTSALAVVTVTADKRNLTVVIKDFFRHFRRRFKEEDILKHIHRDGDVPGVVRSEDSEELSICCGSTEKGDLRTRVRMSLWDFGKSLLEARTVNDLLKAVYDALEVHRTLYCERNVLHRDMSISNILMYPQRADVTGRQVMCDAQTPKFIEDVLRGETRPVENRQACCLLIDMGNAAILDKRTESSVSNRELEHRTGTPMFIARSVCIGRLFISLASITAVGMPALTGDALYRYNTAHGPARYDEYPPETIGGAKQHGFTPPPPPIDHTKFESDIQYVHRPEHDVESIFWTMLYALLLVKPKDGEAAKYASTAFGLIWGPLNSHSIKEDPREDDCRNVIFDRRLSTWIDAFDGCMRDVGVMLCDIGSQVRTEWALWEGSASAPDHLHEAVQRIILQYLVDHSDKDVTLLPGQTRPTSEPKPSLRTETTTGSVRRRLIEPSMKTKPPATSGTSSGKKRKEREAPVTAGSSTTPTSSAHPAKDDDEPSRARKRRKGLSGGRKTRGDGGEGDEA